MLDYTVTFLVFCLFIWDKKGRLGRKVVWSGGGRICDGRKGGVCWRLEVRERKGMCIVWGRPILALNSPGVLASCKGVWQFLSLPTAEGKPRAVALRLTWTYRLVRAAD